MYFWVESSNLWVLVNCYGLWWSLICHPWIQHIYILVTLPTSSAHPSFAHMSRCVFLSAAVGSGLFYPKITILVSPFSHWGMGLLFWQRVTSISRMSTHWSRDYLCAAPRCTLCMRRRAWVKRPAIITSSVRFLSLKRKRNPNSGLRAATQDQVDVQSAANPT